MTFYSFTTQRELKHHLVDASLSFSKGNFDETSPIEIRADTFAAELIYPEEDFRFGSPADGDRIGRMLRRKRDSIEAQDPDDSALQGSC
jgi:Zn-dependent peptidase ImmA (M78 family)